MLEMHQDDNNNNKKRESERDGKDLLFVFNL